jgi:hypothetical protein
LRSGSSNCCCRLLVERCVVCADLSYIAGQKGLFFGAEWCIKVHRRVWHHSINWNGPRPRIIVLKRQEDSRPLGDKKKKKREKKERPKKISNRSGRSPAISLSLSQPTNWSFLDQIRSVLLCFGGATQYLPADNSALFLLHQGRQFNIIYSPDLPCVLLSSNSMSRMGQTTNDR